MIRTHKWSSGYNNTVHLSDTSCARSVFEGRDHPLVGHTQGASWFRKSDLFYQDLLQLDTARPRTRGLCAGTRSPPALGVAGFVSRKKGARSKGKEEKEGENNNSR